MEKQHDPTSLQRLINEPKGHVDYAAGESFMLHVFWETPSEEAAHTLLAGLQQCAIPTHRDTPCTLTYFFRVALNDSDLCGQTPRTIGEHPQLSGAIKKLQRGVPLPAVKADVIRRGLDPALLERDPSSELPVELQKQPVMIECTEIYLDERAFNHHAGSRDYLEAYGAVIQPGLTNRQPTTVRLGTPVATLVDKILAPILKEIPLPASEGSKLWESFSKTTTGTNSDAAAAEGLGLRGAAFISLDVEGLDVSMPQSLRGACTTCVAFKHPLRPGTSRVMCTVPSPPTADVLAALAATHPVRGEVHMTNADASVVEAVATAFTAAGLAFVTVNASKGSGYVLHQEAHRLVVIADGSNP